MKTYLSTLSMLFGFFLFVFVGIAPAGNVYFQEDFTNSNIAIPSMEEFALESVDDVHGQSLKITRVSASHEKVQFPVSSPIPAGQDYVFSMDYKGAGYCMLLDAQKQQIGGLAFGADGKITVLNTEKDKWVPSGIKAYIQEWFTVQIRLNAAAKTFIFLVKDVDGDFESKEWPVISDAPLAFIQLGNTYPIGNVAYADNLSVTEADVVQSAADDKIIILENKFEKPLSAMKGLATNFDIEADPDGEPEFNKSLKISRPTKTHEKIFVSFRKPLPPQHDFAIVMDYKGIGYFILLDANKKQLGGMTFGAKPKALSGKADTFIGTNLQCNPAKWNHFEVNFKMSEGTFSIKMTDDQSQVSETPDYPLAGDGLPAQIQFGNTYPIGNVAYLDNLKAYYDTARSLSGRKNVMTPAELKLAGLVPVESENGLSFALTAAQGSIEFRPDTLREFALVRFDAAPGMAVSMNLTNSAGHNIAISNQGKNGFYEEERKPVLLEKATIQIDGKAGDVLKGLGFWTAYLGNASVANREFEKKLQGDFRLPVYEGNAPALLMLYNKTSEPLPVSITLQERKSKKEVHAPLKARLKTGENAISIPIDELPNGEYLVFVTDDAPGDAIRGSLRRLLRRQVV
ncbi:MAG: hypothetical protein GX946_11415, partial [Oligosphaeraceae bacterium]|nr:hypothetical protein [Oligosphaeraceae bacterium]